MSFKDKVKKIKDSDVFKNLRKKLYLCSCFSIDDDWQYDFYDKKSKKMTSFKIDGGVRLLETESKVFQKEKVDIEKLNLDKVKVDLSEALLKIDKIKKKRVSSEDINKKIVILQCIKVPLWNISYLTTSFNILNVKINANSGELISEKFESLLNFRIKQ